MTIYARLLLATFLVLFSTACSPQPTPRNDVGTGLGEIFETDKLVVVNDEGVRHEFDIYLAQDVEQHLRGLMFVRKLPLTTGMLFVYEGNEQRSMWMKNTYISLDIVYARADGSVSSVIHNTEPLSLRSLVSVEPVQYVLELNAGVARRLKIGTGSRLIWNAAES
ncbi:MAG: DUF192 domain-containing protein [Woeseiaceae bacterium]